MRLLSSVSGLLLIFPVAGCGMIDTGPSPQDVASQFVKSFAAGDSASAAAHTDAPGRARSALDSSRQNMSPQSVNASVVDVTEGDGQRPTKARFDATWDFGQGRAWKYQGEMELVEADDGWKVRWTPSVLHPQLRGEQSLAFKEQQSQPAPVLDRDGTPLMNPEQLVTVSLDPQRAGDTAGVAGSLGGALSSVEPTITQQSILDGVAKTPPGQPYAVVTLRQNDYERVKDQIHDLPGVNFPAQTKLVADQREYGSQVLPGISKIVNDQLEGKSGWQVVATGPGGAETAMLHDTPPQPVDPISATLSDRVQKAAEQAVDPMPQGAMLVALQPSTGDVLAVAQNQLADAQGSVALTGQYPPGSTFKMINATAALESGKVQIDTPVPCPPRQVFNGRMVPNDKEFDLGVVPLRTAFAKSCNTSFAQLAVDQPANSLPNAAKQLGIGVDFEIPGMTTITGKVPPAEQTVQRAANGIGQGSVLASPFGMALASASVAQGGMPTPTLIKGTETRADAAPKPLPQQTLDQLRPMMQEVVNSGTAKSLAGTGPVAAKTGTAQFGDGTHSHGWVTGYRDDLAFAVLVTDAGASGPALDVARNFLTNTQ